MHFDQTIERLSKEELANALDEALASDLHDRLVALIDEIERRGGVVEV